jgi:hypothetical protein
MLGNLNQDETPAITDPYAAGGALWDDINAYCQTQATPAQCRALLGYKPIYFPPIVAEKPIIPFWALLLIGYVLGKNNII